MIPARRLTPKSRVRVILPASSLKTRGMRHDVSCGIEILSRYYSVEYSQIAARKDQSLEATDEEKAAEINEALRSPEIDALIAVRGGYGSLRLLSLIDFESWKRHPKLLIGFSDLTILQLALYHKTSIPSLSGPMVLTLGDKGMEWLNPLLTDDTVGLDLIPLKGKKQTAVVQPGRAEGVLLGGNLFSLVQMIGTGYLPRLENAIFFFEDLNETADRIDSYLQHLKLVGQLYKVAGVLIGDISFRKDESNAGQRVQMETFRRRIISLFRREIPVMMGVNYGHIDDSITIPIGVNAILDTESRSLTLTESVTRG